MNTSRCYVDNCQQPADLRCIQCRQLYCGQHGGRQVGCQNFCRTCYARLIHNLVVANSHAGKLNQVVALLNPVQAQPIAPERRYYLALTQAMSGNLADAEEQLQPLFGQEASHSAHLIEPTRQAMGKILTARSLRHLEAQAIPQAVNDLRQATTLLTESQLQHSLLTALVHQAAAAYFQAGQLHEALREWEQAQQSDPQDLQLAHYIGIVCYRLACQLETDAPGQADPYWQKVIANWVMVIVNEIYSAAWTQKRSKVIGRAPAGLHTQVQQDLIARLNNDFLHYRTHYSAQNQAEHVNRHAGYEVAFVREQQAATEMLAVIRQGHSQLPLVRSACGPLMMEQWRKNPEVSAAIDALARLSPRLQHYISPLGKPFTLLHDLLRYDEASAELRLILKQNAQDKQAKALLTEVLATQSRNLLAENKPARALELLEEALHHATQREPLLVLLTESAVNQARSLLESEQNVQIAIDLLERIQRIYSVRDGELSAQLAQSYFKRALDYHHKERYAESLADLRKALEIDPNNQMAKENLVPALMLRAAELFKVQRLNEAMALCEEGVLVNPQQVNRDLLLALFFQRGIQRANDAIQMHVPYMSYATRTRLLEARADLNTAYQLAVNDREIQQNIQKQIDTINQTLNRLQ